MLRISTSSGLIASVPITRLSWDVRQYGAERTLTFREF